MVTYKLTQNDVEKLFAQKRKGGGFQNLMAELQDRTNKATCKIELTEELKRKIVRYAKYGNGGWEDTVLCNIFSKFDFFPEQTS
ncbi:MAG: hypothetical protein IKH45_08255 [Neisseriaceae bacterium]|nr:hypothetical protein [Neisseriaceae bacterium]